MRESLARAVWYGEGFAGLTARAVLTPAEWVFGAASMLVGSRRAARAGTPQVPTVSVGNLTVGGTGKTPISAWVAAQLARRGKKPALLLRGYGDDETLVHERLNPNVPVFADPERVQSAARAIEAGAKSLVLDDAFQHRQMPRSADIVLVSADLWSNLPARLLPAGPFREPLEALRRAQFVLVTRKAVPHARAQQVADRLRAIVRGVPVGIVHLAPDALMRWSDGESLALDVISGRRVLAISGIGAPEAFESQLRSAGAVEVASAAYADHHAFTDADAHTLSARAAAANFAICTLKDAVKLGPRWPTGRAPLWYLSQSVAFEAGAQELHALLDRLAAH